MADSISDVARRLAENAEAVCRHYLPNGRREGRYWLVGDVHNTPGRSLYVRLRGSACDDRAVGRWTDAAADQHGDLLDLIAAARRLDGIGAALDEARRFLGLAPSTPAPPLPASGRSATREAFPRRTAMAAVPAGTAEAARRLFGMSIADRRHARQHLSGGARHRRDPRYDRAALSSAVLVPAGG